jgi:uncharacterized protein (TIGR02594 family)
MPTPAAKPVLYSLGDSGDAVKTIQVALAKLGYHLNGTGYFGNATDVAVTAFQRAAGLTPDGDVGDKTLAAIQAAVGNKAPADLAPDGHSTSPVPSKTVVANIGRPLWLEAGIHLIGTQEGPGTRDNQVIIDWAKDEGGEIAKEYDHDSIPWCALFANHCLRMADLKGTGTLWALDFAGHWPAVKLNGPAVGAFAPMLRNGGGHIGIVAGKDQNGSIMLLGGNQSDAVNIKPFATSRLNQGFWWPKSVPLPTRIGMASLPVIRSDGQVSHNEA